MKSETIKKEISNIDERISELAGTRTELERTINQLNESFFSKKVSLDDVHAEQTKLNTLNSAIKAAENKRAEAQERLSEAEQVESDNDFRFKAKTAVAEADNARNEYLQIREEFSDMVGDFAQRLLKAGQNFGQKQRELSRIIDKNNSFAKPISSDLVQESSVVRQRRESIPYSRVEYAEIVDTAINVLVRKMERKQKVEV